jgi:hypothetical protein
MFTNKGDRKVVMTAMKDQSKKMGERKSRVTGINIIKVHYIYV